MHEEHQAPYWKKHIQYSNFDLSLNCHEQALIPTNSFRLDGLFPCRQLHFPLPANVYWNLSPAGSKTNLDSFWHLLSEDRTIGSSSTHQTLTSFNVTLSLKVFLKCH